MDGIHDLGGMHGFGPIEIEADEPRFHHDWERRVFALQMLAPFVTEFNPDQMRRQIERIEPRRYLNSSYYQLWLEGLIGQLQEMHVISDEELDRAHAVDALPKQFDTGNQAQAGDLLDVVAAGAQPAELGTDERPHRFVAGERVRTKSHMTSDHNRLPRYVRGKTGTVIAEHGNFVLPDTSSAGLGPHPQMVYCVEFLASELWGPDAEQGARVCLDLWDTYLTPVN